MKSEDLILYVLSTLILVAVVIVALYFIKKLKQSGNKEQGKAQIFEEIVALMFLRTINVNLTDDTYIIKTNGGSVCHKGYDSNIVAADKMSIAEDEDRDDYVNTFSREAMLQAFTKGDKNIKRRYRIVSKDAVERYIEFNSFFLSDSTKDNVKAIILCRETEPGSEYHEIENKLMLRDVDFSELRNQKKIMIDRIARQTVQLDNLTDENERLKQEIKMKTEDFALEKEDEPLCFEEEGTMLQEERFSEKSTIENTGEEKQLRDFKPEDEMSEKHKKEIERFRKLIEAIDDKNAQLDDVYNENQFDYAVDSYKAKENDTEKLDWDQNILMSDDVSGAISEVPEKINFMGIPQKTDSGSPNGKAAESKLIFDEAGVTNLKLVMKGIVGKLQEMCESANVGLSIKFGNLINPIVYADSADINAMILEMITDAVACAQKNTNISFAINQTSAMKYGYANYEFATTYVGNPIKFDGKIVREMGGTCKEMNNIDGSKSMIARFRFELR